MGWSWRWGPLGCAFWPFTTNVEKERIEVIRLIGSFDLINKYDAV